MLSALFLAGVCATAAFPYADVNLQWSAVRHDTCGDGFPGCPSPTAANFTWSVFSAVDVDAMMEMEGPTDILAKDENQVLVLRFDQGWEYAVWIDDTTTPRKVLNCSKAPIPLQTPWQLRQSFLGFCNKSSLIGTRPCGSGVCDVWEWVNKVACSGPGGNGTIHEPERWFLGQTASHVFSGMTNDILWPAACGEKGPFYHSDWTDSWAPHPAPAVFAVPDDCAPVARGQLSVHPALRQASLFKPSVIH